MLAYSSFVHAAPLSSAPPSVLSSPSSQSGAPTADKGPSTEMEAPTAAQQGIYHIAGNFVQEKLLQIYQIDYKSLKLSLQAFDIGNPNSSLSMVVPKSAIAAVSGDS